MTITEVSALNLKGQSFTHKLTPLNVVVGDNASGKTSILIAARLGLLGYEPGLSAKKPDIFTLSSGSQMNASVTFSDGVTNRLNLKQGKTGSISGDIDIQKKIPPVLLDLSEYFAIPKNKRTAFLLQRVGMSAVSVEDLLALPAVRKASIQVNTKSQDNGPFELVLEHLRELRLNAKREIDMLQGAVGTAINAEGQQAVAQNVEQPIKEKQAEISALNWRLQALKAELATIDAKTQSLMALRESVQTATVDKPIGSVSWERLIEMAEESMKTIQLGALECEEALELDAALHAAILSNGSRITQSKSVLKQLESRMKEDMERCPVPVCEHCQKPVEALRGMVAQSYTVQTTREQETLAKENAAYEVNVNLKAGLQPKVLSFKSAKAEIERHTGSISELRQKIARAQAQAESNAARVRDLEKAETEWSALRPRDFIIDEGRETKAQLLNAEKALGELQSSHSLWIAQKADERRASEAAEARAKKQADADVLTAAIDAVLEKQTEILSKAIGPLMKKASEFTCAVLGFSIEFREGDIGYINQTSWVSYKTLSGAEEMLAFIGLAMAFASESPIRLVIVDEMGRFSRKNKTLLLDTLQTLIDMNKIDQAILVDVDAEFYHGVSTINIIPVKQ